MKFNISIFLLIAFLINVSAQKKYSNKFINEKKNLVKKLTQDSHKQTQIMVDKVFSFAELGFHEVESSKYLTSILEKANFKIEYEISDIPTAWFAKWSNGSGPIIALGSDVDGIPKASQYP